MQDSGAACKKACLGLLSEALCLGDWVVQLGVGIGHLPPVHKQLEALCEARLASMPEARQAVKLLLGRNN